MPRSQGTSRKGKPKKNERAAGMGRALTKSQQQKFRPKSNGASRGAGMAMAPGTYDIGGEDPTHRSTQQSVLEMDDLTDFLSKAELAGREFASEREQFVVLDQAGQEYKRPRDPKISWSDQPRKQDFVFQELSVPRRPAWDETTTPAELDKRERESFLEWRRAIAQKEEELLEVSGDDVRVTPFEKNLEVWRQLWRVLERCSCLLQIVDGRNPLFYLNSDLRTYATTELGKPMLLVVNKSDYLSPKQRQLWHEYLSQQGWDHVFFSAHDEQVKLDEAARSQRPQDDQLATPLAEPDVESENGVDSEEQDSTTKTTSSSFLDLRKNVGVDAPLTRQELLDWMRNFATHYKCERDQRFSNKVQFGTLGFPNVGKSSVINVLIGNSKHTHGLVRVGVASQPGKTKHFQTLFLPDDDDMMLCDCPGLVFPSFVSSTADLIAAGVYPISQMRDPWPVVRLICQRIPKQVLEAQYGIKLVPTGEEGTTSGGPSNSTLPPTAEELLSTICIARSLLSAGSGIPDYQQASRLVIKDYATGKLLYCHAPPTVNGDDDSAVFERETLETTLVRTKKLRDKLDATELVAQTNSAKEEEANAPSHPDPSGAAIDDDLDLLEFLDVTPSTSAPASSNGGKRGKSHKSMQKWGKKGRKNRNKDPYGCHSTPDDELGGMIGQQQRMDAGVVVNAGKYGRKGYTRPTSFGGARSAVR